MPRRNRELWAALIAILAISGLYALVVAWIGDIPGASGLFGHSLGILGFTLMLMTETLYTIRKRQRTARWGRMSSWLEFHIFTGIVGPYLVLLHSSWKFNGLAGMVTLMTLTVVVSGFIGRYIYTSVPRTLDGVELEASQIRDQIQAIEAQLISRVDLSTQGSQVTRPLPMPAHLPAGGPAVAAYTPPAVEFDQPPLWGVSSQPATDEQLEQLVKRRAALNRQLSGLAMARRLMALWHAIHVPLGLALFTAAFIHILAAIYYASLLC